MLPSCNRSGGSILRRRPLLSLLAILISLCIILSCTLWRKLNLQRYFGTNTRKQKIDVPIILSLNEEEEKGTKKLQPKADTGRSSPACRPHFQLALPDGKWSDSIKFKRLYFYHVRKAGVRILKRITCTLCTCLALYHYAPITANNISLQYHICNTLIPYKILPIHRAQIYEDTLRGWPHIMD